MICTYLHTFNIRNLFISTGHQNSQLHTMKGNAEESPKSFPPFSYEHSYFLCDGGKKKINIHI